VPGHCQWVLWRIRQHSLRGMKCQIRNRRPSIHLGALQMVQNGRRGSFLSKNVMTLSANEFNLPHLNQNAETLTLSLQRLPLESPGLGLCRLPDFSSRQRASFPYVMQLSRLLCGFRLSVHLVHGSTTTTGVFGH
jgi:hypothetical protein